jgi:hypothetical protein
MSDPTNSAAAAHARTPGQVIPVRDPDNEFVHLYEIGDAIAKHLGGQNAAEKMLRIDHHDWSRFGDLTNNQPLQQSRHRGKHPEARRSADVPPVLSSVSV